MKKILLTVLLLFSLISSAFAIDVTINGEPLATDTPAQLVDDCTMVPLRDFYEALGATVEWDSTQDMAIITKDDTVVTYALNSIVAEVSGDSVTLDAPMQIVDDTAFVPARFAAESLGGELVWDDATQSVAITLEETQSKGLTNVQAVVGFIFLIWLFLFLHSAKQKSAKKRAAAEEKKQYNEKYGVEASIRLPHVNGLPIAENTQCELELRTDHVIFTADGLDFKLKRDTITDASIKTSTEIQSQYVSSIGGAVAGAMLFGGLGAIVGGRAKEKKTKTITHYFIITYLKDDEVRYISFEVATPSIPVMQFIELCNVGKGQRKTINL